MRALALVCVLAGTAAADRFDPVDKLPELAKAGDCDKLRAGADAASTAMLDALTTDRYALTDATLDRLADDVVAALPLARCAKGVEPLTRLGAAAANLLVGSEQPHFDTLDPQPIPKAVERRQLGFVDRLADVVGKDSDAGMAFRFLRARALGNYQHFDDALAIYLDIIDHHAQLPFAPYAVGYVLEIDVRTHHQDDMFALVDRLLADKHFLEHRDDLARQLHTIQRRGKRDKLAVLAQDAQTANDPTKFRACGDGFLATFRDDPDDPAGDELLYNATVCYLAANARTEAVVAVDLLAKRFPKSPLLAQARKQFAH